MRVVTPQITWHNRDPVLCVDFDPNSGPTKDEGSDFYRLATGGSDSHVLIWHLKDPSSVKVDISCVAELTRHTKTVNTLRFSPCGKYLASADDDAYVYIWKHDVEDIKPDQEFWTVEKALRKHIDDVSDLSWSFDSQRLVTTSVDNSAVVWDVKKGVSLHCLSEHTGFVQGATFDPSTNLVATIATDRFLRLFNTQTGKLELKALKYPKKWLPKKKRTPIKDENEQESPDKTPKKQVTPPPCNRLFHDDTLKSFCRRLNYSPNGEFLVVPGGILPRKRKGEEEKLGDKSSTTPDDKGSKKEKEKPLSDRNAVVIFCRNSLTNPCSVIPTGTSYSIAARFCPTYFQRRREIISYDKDLVNPAKRSERMVTCVGKLQNSKQGKKSLLDMPFRLVFAVGTNDSLIISDTDSVTPLAVIRNIHLTRLSDLSWSADGRVLIASSTDGYCSVVSFEQNELGLPMPSDQEIQVPIPQAYPIPPPPTPKVMKATKSEPKTKDPASATPPSAKKAKKKETKKVPTPTVPTPPPRVIPRFFQGNFKHKMRKIEDHPPLKNNNDYKLEPPEPKPVLIPVPVEVPVVQIDNVAASVTIDNPTPIQVTPKRNTFLESWLKKSQAAADEEGSSPLKPIDVTLNSNSELAPPPIQTPSPPPATKGLKALLTPDQVHQLQNAPIKVDMEADQAANDASVFMSSETRVFAVTPVTPVVAIENLNTDIVTPVSRPFPPISATPTTLREKRPATSPLTSHQNPKQPRRVAFITLSKDQ